MDNSVLSLGLAFDFYPSQSERWKSGLCKLEMNKFLPFETNTSSNFLTYLYHAHSQIWAPEHEVIIFINLLHINHYFTFHPSTLTLRAKPKSNLSRKTYSLDTTLF